MARTAKLIVADIITALNEYIENTENPEMIEFAHNYGMSRSRLYAIADENQLLKDTIKKAIEKQELFMIRGASLRKLDPTFCIFRLKQPTFGYKDKTEQEINANINMTDAEKSLLEKVSDRLKDK